VVDSPGFGDTRGIERDGETVRQLKSLFSTDGELGIYQLDAIAFVVQSSNARLTATQKYIFSAILSMFGADAVKNLLVIATFADDGEPQVMHAIREEKINYQRLLKFNNSALFGPNPAGTDTASSLYWKVGVQGYADLFAALSLLQPQSLALTCEVLNERQQLQAAIQGLHQLIRRGIAELDRIEQEQHILDQHSLDIQANSNFTKTVFIQKEQQIRSPPGRFVTNCVICNKTCHLNCAFSDNADKIHCSAMDPNGHCHECPGKCMWHDHQNQPFYWESTTEAETVTIYALKAKYADAKQKHASSKDMLANAQRKYDSIRKDLSGLVEQARQHVNRLGEIAARQNPLSSTDYIDLLIQSEQGEAKSGWQVRIKFLQDVRVEAETEEALRTPGEFVSKMWRDRAAKSAVHPTPSSAANLSPRKARPVTRQSISTLGRRPH
jgi:hypothetical protein